MNHRRTTGSAHNDEPHAHGSSGGLRPLEVATVIHVAGLLLAASWAFGGGATWARTLIAAWGSAGVVLAALAIRNRARRGENLRHPLVWLGPFLLFNVLVLVSCLNPSFTPKVYEGGHYLAFTGSVHPALPSTIHVATTLNHLWLFDAIYLACFNLTLCIRRRRALRRLLLVACINAIVLAIFGTFQKFAADGLFFGLVTAPNPRFFSTFIYGNHWAAYVLLFLAACTGLVFYYARHRHDSAGGGSPLAMGIVGLLLMAVTPTLAGSRAGTGLVLLLLGSATVHALLRIRRARREHGQSVALPVAGLALCVLVTVGGAAYLGREPLRERWRDTQGQWQQGLFGERLRLYADTCRLAAAEPAFGWGLGNFERSLLLIRPRPLEANRQYEHSYVDAHSDWLQSFAEVGIAGTLLVALCALVPLLSSRALRFAGPLPAYLLLGCGLILAYAGFEFPFGNPAVTVAFWVCFFSAIQYVRLSSRAGR